MNTLETTQGDYSVFGYWLPEGLQGRREHVCTLPELARCIEQANAYATATRFAQVISSTSALVYDTRKPEERQAERCAVCRLDLDKSATRTEQHGLKFCGLSCLIAWEEKQEPQEYIVTVKVSALSPQVAPDKAADLLNAGGEPESVTDASARRYSVWFSDIEGVEDSLTMTATDAEAQTVEAHLRGLKDQSILADYVVVLDSSYSPADALEYINEKLDLDNATEN